MKKNQKIYDVVFSLFIVLLTTICLAGSTVPIVQIDSPTDSQIFRSTIQQLTIQGWSYTTDGAGYSDGSTEYWVDTDEDGTANEVNGSWQSIDTYIVEKGNVTSSSVSVGTMDTRKLLRQNISESVYRSGFYIIRMTGTGNNALETTDTVPIQIRKARRPTW